MKKAIVIMNETHSMMEEQKEILEREYEEYEILPVPASGWTLKEIDSIIETLIGHTVVFVSPIPYMIMGLTRKEYFSPSKVRIFHNDRREKKELPNGKIIQVVAKTGWQLV